MERIMDSSTFLAPISCDLQFICHSALLSIKATTLFPNPPFQSLVLVKELLNPYQLP
jgi:hypothetical protein